MIGCEQAVEVAPHIYLSSWHPLPAAQNESPEKSGLRDATSASYSRYETLCLINEQLISQDNVEAMIPSPHLIKFWRLDFRLYVTILDQDFLVYCQSLKLEGLKFENRSVRILEPRCIFASAMMLVFNEVWAVASARSRVEKPRNTRGKVSDGSQIRGR